MLVKGNGPLAVRGLFPFVDGGGGGGNTGIVSPVGATTFGLRKAEDDDEEEEMGLLLEVDDDKEGPGTKELGPVGPPIGRVNGNDELLLVVPSLCLSTISVEGELFCPARVNDIT